MQPFSWSKAELLQSRASEHAKVDKRYSLDNEHFDFSSPKEVFWALDGHGLLKENATYFSADFALVEPDCLDIDEFLGSLEARYLVQFEPIGPLCFTDVDEVARTARRRAIDNWIEEYLFVGRQWCMVGVSQQLVVSRTDIPSQSNKSASSNAAGTYPASFNA